MSVNSVPDSLGNLSNAQVMLGTDGSIERDLSYWDGIGAIVANSARLTLDTSEFQYPLVNTLLVRVIRNDQPSHIEASSTVIQSGTNVGIGSDARWRFPTGTPTDAAITPGSDHVLTIGLASSGRFFRVNGIDRTPSASSGPQTGVRPNFLRFGTNNSQIELAFGPVLLSSEIDMTKIREMEELLMRLAGISF